MKHLFIFFSLLLLSFPPIETFGQIMAPPDLYFNNLESSEMRGVNLVGCVPLNAGAMPNQPSGLYTGFTWSMGSYSNTSGTYYNLKSFVNDPANCHGNWCARADLNTSSSGVASFDAGYSAGNMPFGCVSANGPCTTYRRFFRMYMKFSAGLRWSTCANLKIMYMRASSTGGTAFLHLSSSTGTSFHARIENTNPSANSPQGWEIPFDGKWHCLEVEMDPQGQYINAWWDAAQVVNWRTPIYDNSNQPYLAVNQVTFGMYINPVGNGGCAPSYAPPGGSFWVDDMAISTRRIGMLAGTASLNSNERNLMNAGPREMTIRIQKEAVQFYIPEKGRYELSVRDVSGREIWATQDAASFAKANFETENNGTYLAVLRQNGRQSVKRFCVLK